MLACVVLLLRWWVGMGVKGWRGAYGDEMHSDAVDAVAVVRDCFAIVIVGFRERRHRCNMFPEIDWRISCWW